MSLGRATPLIYVVSEHMFDRHKGINVAEVEFPAYFSFFIKQQKVTFVASEAVEQRVRTVFRETLLGPESYDGLAAELGDGVAPEVMPDLARECAALRTFESIDELMSFKRFDEDVGHGVTIRSLPDLGLFSVVQDGAVELARVPRQMHLPQSPLARRLSITVAPFDPPQFGVTVLGNSSGFDSKHDTTGLLVWIGGRGVLVDPPVDCIALLHKAGIPSRLITAVVISHCHADHDSGAFQWLLHERKLELITTPTVAGSFLRKYAALLDLPMDELRELFVFHAARVGERMRYRGADFIFHYGLHTIPSVGFECFFSGKSLLYSGDTCVDPEVLRRIHEDDGAMTAARRDQLLRRDWHHSLILHEAGVPPIHTPVSLFVDLPDDIKKRLLLVHTTAANVPEGSGLRVAEAGAEHSIILDDRDTGAMAQAVEVLDALDSAEIFRELQIPSRELLLCAQVRRYEAGAVIVERGCEVQEGSAGLFVIKSGVCSIFAPQVAKNLIAGDFFGEQALLPNHKRRTATVLARTDVTIVSIGRTEFPSLVRGNEDIIRKVVQLAAMRRDESWAVLQRNAVLHRLSQAQKTALQAIMAKHKAVAGEQILVPGQQQWQVAAHDADDTDDGGGGKALTDKGGDKTAGGGGGGGGGTTALFPAVLIGSGVFSAELDPLLSATDVNRKDQQRSPASCGSSAAAAGAAAAAAAATGGRSSRLSRGGGSGAMGPRLVTKGFLVGDLFTASGGTSPKGKYGGGSSDTVTSVSLTCAVDGEFYSFEREGLRRFLDDNPGIRLSLLDCRLVPAFKDSQDEGYDAANLWAEI